MALTQPTYTVEADFNQDGTYETNITQLVTRNGFRVSRGINQKGEYRTSQLNLTMFNTDGTYTPEYSSSSLFGLVKPHVPIRVTATHNGTSYTVWTGYIIESENRYSRGELPKVELRAQDLNAYNADFAPVNILVDERTTTEAMEAIDTAMGLTSADRDYDTGIQTLPYHFARLVNAKTAREQVLLSEMGGSYFIRADGRQRFESRQSRLGLSQFDRDIKKMGAKRYYKFNEPSGTVGYDWGTDGANLTYSNTPTLGQTGAIDSDPTGAAKFETANSEYATASNPAISTTGGCFLMLVKLTTVDSGTPRFLFDTKPSDFGAVRIYQWFGTYYWSIGADAAQTYGSAVADTWIMLGVQWAGGDHNLIVNGAVVDTYTYTDPPASNTLLIGQGNGGNYADATYSRFAYFDRELTDAELLRLQNDWTGMHFGDDTEIQATDANYRMSTDDIATSFSVRAVQFYEGQDSQAVFTFSRGQRTADSLAIASGQYYIADFNYESPIASLVTPVSTTDYRANAAIDGSGADRTSSLSVSVTDLGAGFRLVLTNTHASTIYVTFFQLRGVPVTFSADRPVFTVTKEIDGRKTGAGAAIDLPFATDADNLAKDYALALTRIYRLPYPMLTLDFTWSNDDTVAAMLAMELGDLVYYSDTDLGTKGPYVDDWWYVMSYNHSIKAPGNLSTTQVVLVPSYIYRNLDRIVYDDFGRSNASGDLGTALSRDVWANDTGFDISSSRARANTNSATVATLDLGTKVVDQRVETTLYNLSGDSDEEVGVVYRYIDSSNYWRAYVDDGSDEVILEKVVAGVVTELSSPAWTPVSGAEIWAMAQGNRHRVWVGGKLYIDVRDNALNLQTATKVGIFARNASGTVQFDDFYGQGM